LKKKTVQRTPLGNSVTMGELKIAKTKHDFRAVMRRFVLMPLQWSSGKGVFSKG